MSTANANDNDKVVRKDKTIWLVYLAAAIAGILLLADVMNITVLEKISARLGIGLLYSAVALLIANGRASGIIASLILWAAIIITFLV